MDRPIPPTKKSNWFARVRSHGLFSIAKFTLSVVLIVVVINSFGLQSYEVFGQSMQPTLHHGDRLLISKLGKSVSRLFQRDYVPDRGDIIVFGDPYLPNRQLIKRVVGLPGERIILGDGIFTIINAEHPEGFNPDLAFDVDYVFTIGEVNLEVPEHHLFVVGDNRGPGGSLDSRNELQTIPIDKVVGTLVLRVFPLSDLELF